MGASCISMVRMVTVGKHFPKKRESIAELKALENAYLDGMREILSEVAAKRHHEMCDMRSDNPHVRKVSEESHHAINSFYNSLNETQSNLYGRIEETINIERALEEKEIFVIGFLEGYRFIKELQRSGGGLTLV
ncbi:hypothetical protein [Paenibacillus sinopodophylli]|uniref:hypothetical protein n=1 Tax=Paenibacillus sinopodophylli TaxID=1837342 RepID=UPI00110D136B|nr:hypothetical protein [Paenibacillus sinopodophylli]